MAEGKRLFLTPQYMRDFKCIGSDCEDTCCVGWKVYIDKDTYKKYRALNDEELKPKLDRCVTRDRSPDSDLERYAKINMDHSGGCPLLNDDLLCTIQLKHGEKYLSKVCASYPRTTNIVNGTIEQSTTLSCPAAARLALLQPNGIEFDEFEDDVEKVKFFNFRLTTQDKSLINTPAKFFWDLRVFTISLLQNRAYSLWERLIILGFFSKKLQELADEKRVNEIPLIINSYTKMVDEGEFRKNLLSIPVLRDIQIVLIKQIVDIRRKMGMSNKIYAKCYEEFARGLEYTDEAKIEEISERYKNSFETYYKTFMDDNEYILENYLVNYVFKDLYPLVSNTLFDSYMLLVIHYALVKVHLVGMAAYHKGLNQELAVKLIHSLTRTFDHRPDYIKAITDLMRKNKYNTLSYMAILIRN